MAAPIPRLRRDIIIRGEPDTGGWPKSTDEAKEKADFGVTGDFKGSYLQEVDGQAVLVGNYPAGSYAGSTTVGIAGFIFEATGNVDITKAKQASLKYQVKFDDDFAFAEGGKLPGLYGGDNDEIAKKCAGGYHNDECWSARIMWRANGAGELYAYLPSANQDLPVCKDKCDVKYGASIDTGAWTFKAGEWTDVEEKVTLNDIGQKNAQIEILIGGQSRILVQGLELRSKEEGRIRGAMIHTFFGGSSSPSFQSPKDQKAEFRDFSITVVEELTE